MRSRSNSGVRLDYYYRIVQKTILQHQDPITGLLPASADYQHAWVRDNVYSILAVWGLSMAYKKNADLDEDRAKTYELEMSCVKLMRALLTSMMLQKDKIEKFKWSQVSLLLTTASGNNGNDYGIWERGDKTNHGLPELNASSIGLAKAALEAMNELDLFGARGGPASVIHVLADEAHKCQAVLQSMLPRESSSKEVDSGLLGVISFPAFAVDDPELIKRTRHTILSKLRGKYGCKRFLWDGYKTPKEDPNRLYYEPRELKMFENIECEWPLFICYLILDAQFQGDKALTQEYCDQLDKMLVTSDEGLRLVPEMYAVPAHKADLECKKPGSQERVVAGKLPLMWAQSLYIVGRLLHDNFLACGELDPLNRRLGSEKKPDVVVQVVLLAEDAAMQSKLAAADIHVQTIAEVAPIEVQPARVLSKLYAHLGRNQKLGLSGRQSLDVGILSTSKLYCLQDRVFAFTPQFSDTRRFFIASDLLLLIDIFKTELNFLQGTWKNMLGRPTVVLEINQTFLEDGKVPTAMVATVKKLNSGYINGTRVALGKMADFLNTSCMTSLNFLHDTENGYPDSLKPEVKQYLSGQMRGSLAWRRSDLVKMSSSSKMESISEEVPGDPSDSRTPLIPPLVPPSNPCTDSCPTRGPHVTHRKDEPIERFSRAVGSNRQQPAIRR
ncbi:probable phosphorylase b kinase regulatory subunit alpha, partial [Hyalella azteca]|uniref:Phosphorylase b kinase regulatory subunit n=1 Tax=Hyalella azteca TaxID=294128 RepID=A0A979FHV0_HYAAZ